MLHSPIENPFPRIPEIIFVELSFERLYRHIPSDKVSFPSLCLNDLAVRMFRLSDKGMVHLTEPQGKEVIPIHGRIGKKGVVDDMTG
jgi:hypothetical protein